MMAQFAVAPNKVMVNKQFNSPINLYSTTAVNETLAKQTTILSNGAIGIDFNQLAAPNLAKSAVLRMLEEEEVGSRGEHVTCRRNQTARVWPPTPPNSPPSRTKLVHEKRTTFSIDWPPKSTSSTAECASNALTTEQTNSSWRHRSSNRQGLKRVAWPPPPELDGVSVTTQPQDFQNPQGDQNYVNGDTLQSYPPAPLLYSPPIDETQTRWQAEPVYCSSVVAPNQQQPFAPVAPQTTVYSRPVIQTPPPPSTVILRPTAPISQAPPPVIKSQPALQQKQIYTTTKMRGDQKWPPADVKALKEAEDTANLTKGPAVKPRLVKKDYSSFFAQHALQPTYAGYRAPPGTQHYAEDQRPDGN